MPFHHEVDEEHEVRDLTTKGTSYSARSRCLNNSSRQTAMGCVEQLERFERLEHAQGVQMPSWCGSEVAPRLRGDFALWLIPSLRALRVGREPGDGAP